MKSYPAGRKETLTFKCFNRKGWSLFACLGREVRIVALSAATLATATQRLDATGVNTTEPFAPTVGDTLKPEEAAVVTASRAPIGGNAAARQVTTLSREDIATAGVTCVSDVLKLAAGVDVRQRGGFGVQTDISIDGGTFDELALLINGVPYNNPQTGHNAMQFPFTLADIERIEVLEGGASRVFGSQAFSGAINIVTRTSAATPPGSGRTLHGEAGLAGGSYGLAGADARLSLRPGASWSTSLSASARRSDGATDNSDFKQASAFWQAAYNTANARLNTQAGFTTCDFGANTFYSPANNRQWEATRRFIVSANGLIRVGKGGVQPLASWVRSLDHYQWRKGEPIGENYNRTDVFTLGLSGFLNWFGGTTSLGFETREESLLSGNLGTPMDSSRFVRIHGSGGRSYTRSADRTNISVYAEHNLHLAHWTLSAGALLMRNNALDHSWRFFPGIDASYSPSRHWRFYASLNRSLRLPTFTDLWYKSPSQEGNIGLRPEKNTALRLGADYETSWLTARIKVFLNRGTDMIDWVMRHADDVFHATGFRLTSGGAGLSVAVRLSRLLGARQPFNQLSIDYQHIAQKRHDEQEVFKSNYALEYLRHKLTARLAHRILPLLEASWVLRVQKRRGAYLEYINLAPTGRLIPYGTHALLDCKLTYTLLRATLTLDLQNLTAHRYYDLGGVRQPGFIAMGGVRFSF